MLSKKKANIFRGLAALFGALLFVFIVGSVIAEEQKTYLDQALGTKSQSIETVEEEGVDLYTFKSDYDTTQEMVDADMALAVKVAQQGSVLLRNDENALPLSGDGLNVTLLGTVAYSPFLGGGIGSSASDNSGINSAYAQVGLVEALAEEGVSINPDMRNAYLNCGVSPTKVGFGPGTVMPSFGPVETESQYTINEASAAELDAVTSGISSSSFGEYTDAAIIMVGRPSSEAWDLNAGQEGLSDSGRNAGTDTSLGLTDNERALVDIAVAGGAEKVIVLVNSDSPMEIDYFAKNENVDAVMWVGTPGPYGFRGVVDLLLGEDDSGNAISPTGHLTDTYAVDSLLSPAVQNYGVYVWSNKNDISTSDADGSSAVTNGEALGYADLKATAYEVQAENIYIGYKYYETRYYDAVTTSGLGDHAGAAGTTATVTGSDGWDYGEEVTYSFGYGMSYDGYSTTQTLESVSVDWDSRTITATVDVDNANAHAVTDVVQLYVSLPYTQTDVTNKVEKSAIQLLDFEKVTVPANTSDYKVTMTADMQYIASWDSTANEGNGSYILSEGTYYFAIGNGAHEAVNNVLQAQGVNVGGNTDKVDSSFVLDSRDTTTFSVSKNDVEVSNQLEDADFNYYYDDDPITYLTRSDWDGTFPEEYSDLAATDEMIFRLRNRTYEVKTGERIPDTWGQDNGDENLTLAALKGADFNDERWYYLLNQITLEEAVEIIEYGGNATWVLDSINNPYAKQADGPNGFNGFGIGAYSTEEEGNPYLVAADDPNNGYTFGTLPNAPVIAATFSKQIARECGRHLGNESLWTGSPVIWAGGANVHRTPYCGRTHEYYSEDSMLSNLILDDFCAGGLELGCLIGPKHFAFNDYEHNRCGLAPSMTEQQARENDLRAFQGAFENGSALAGMTAFNRIGVSYINGHTGLMQSILRGEWAYKGLLTTDMVNNQYLMTLAETINGGITMMANSSTRYTAAGQYWEYASADNIKGDANLTHRLRENMHYQWYAYANSNVMNGWNESTRTIQLMTWWRALLISGIVVFAVFAAASVAMYILIKVKGKEVAEKEVA